MSIRAALTVLTLAFIGFSLWEYMSGWPPLRYRLTLEVEDNGQITRGSSVVQVKFWDSRGLPDASRLMSTVKGEAVIVDLGARGLLFALLTGDVTRADSARTPEALLTSSYPEFVDGITSDAIFKVRRGRAPTNIPFDRLPMLVRFRDINDASTVELVNPNNLATDFGPGVRLVRGTIEITGDPVTTGVEKKLGWLDATYPERLLDESVIGKPIGTIPIVSTLTYGSFLRVR